MKALSEISSLEAFGEEVANAVELFIAHVEDDVSNIRQKALQRLRELGLSEEHIAKVLRAVERSNEQEYARLFKCYGLSVQVSPKEVH